MKYAKGFEWLEAHEEGWQYGEAGVLRELGRRASATLCVEVGVGPSVGGGLSCGLLAASGVRLVGIDQDDSALRSWNGKVSGEFVYVKVRSSAPTIDQVLTRVGCGVPEVLTIDVDSNDFYLWAASSIRPEVVMVEHQDQDDPEDQLASAPAEWDCRFIPDIGKAVQANFSAVRELAIGKGYTAIAWNRINGIYLRNDFWYSQMPKD